MTARSPSLPLEQADAGSQRAGRYWLLLVGWAALVFAAVAPALPWMEFVNGSENLNVATVMEIHRTGQWLLPTLQDEPRIAKPPLTAWITALATPASTLNSLDAPDADAREAAYTRLAWQVRWPSLLMACAALVVVGELGRQVAGQRVGLLAAIIAGSSVLFLQQARIATTDVPLWLWVAVANLLLARLLLDGWTYGMAAGAGVALALAFMSKGPVCLAQALAPAGAFLLWRRWVEGRSAAASLRPRIGPVLAGLGVMLVLGLAWYVLVLVGVPGALARWKMELLRTRPNLEPGAPWLYIALVPLLIPWIIPFLGGLGLAGMRLRPRRPAAAPDRRSHALVLMLLLMLVPVLIMSCFPDRRERYLLPMLGPCAVLAAWGLEEFLSNWRHRRRALDYAAAIAHWALVAAIAVGLPLAGAIWLRTVDGEFWYTIRLAAFAAGGGAGLVLAGILAFRRNADALPVTTALVMLAAGVLFIGGYRNSDDGRAEMRPLARTIHLRAPGAEVYYSHPRPEKLPPEDLSIYLNRVIIREADPASIPRSPRPQILTLLQVKGRPEPRPAGPDWKWFDSAPRGPDRLVAFVRWPQ